MIVVRTFGPQSLLRAAVIAAALLSPFTATAYASPIQQIATFPRDGADRAAPEAELYFVFDQPTAKSGSFSVADLDSGAVGTLLTLDAPRWSALGDTVFLKPTFPLRYGHRHGMRVGVILAPDPLNNNSQLPIVYFNVSPRANVVRIGPADLFPSISLVPGVPTPFTLGVRETAGTAAMFTRARYRLYAEEEHDLTGSFSVVPLEQGERPVSVHVPRGGVATLSVPITLSRATARAAGRGPLGVQVDFEGFDETGLPYTFSASSRVGVTATSDSALILTRGLVTPGIASAITVGSVFLVTPLPGAAIAAGDTLIPQAVVTGIGTGSFRGAFYMDGEMVAIAEGFLEAGRPDTVAMRGPLPTRRVGEHRLQFVVESPQNVAASPVTFLCVPPPHGVTALPDERTPVTPPGPAGRATLNATWLSTGGTKYRGEDASATGWAAWRGSAALGGGARLEASGTMRVRFDDTKNGSASPEQAAVRLVTNRATVEWGDAAPALAAGATLFASPVPRRAAQATWHGGGLGTVQAYVALDAHPRSAGGVAREARSDLYAARLSRAVGPRLQVSAYGGYTHEDPTPGALETATRARAVYGGSGTLLLAGGWRWSGDIASVRHRAIEGVETGRTRTGVRSEVTGRIAGADLRAEGFRYQPDLATELNPYALSDRQGAALAVGYDIKGLWRIFGDYRFEEPAERLGPLTTPFGPLGGAPYVSVERLALGTRLSLGPAASVTPVLIRVRHRGDQTNLTEKRLSSEFRTAEEMGGYTSARFDVALFDDDLGVAQKRRLVAGSFVTSRRHPGNITSTLGVGIENDDHDDLDLVDRTLQGTFELRWEASPGRLLVTPYVVYADRRWNTRGVRQEQVSGRLQIALVRIPFLRDGSVSLEGRVDRLQDKEPRNRKATDGAISLTIAQRLPLVP